MRSLCRPQTQFQFLGRNSGRSDVNLSQRGDNAVHVSIPRSEFWSFGLRDLQLGGKPGIKFQFLGRNSGRSDARGRIQPSQSTPRFNSSVGILVVRTIGAKTRRGAAEPVSIPRSEFWSFGRAVAGGGRRNHRRCFNSSVGILVVRT